MNRVNAIPNMIRNEDFNAMSKIAFVNNDDVGDILADEIKQEIESDTDDELEDGIQKDWDGTSYGKAKSDFILELGNDSFNDKEEFVRGVKLYSCKWKLRACKRKRSGSFDITVYDGPHTCLHSKITQDHPNLDASLIAQEVQHLIKEQPSITITALKAEIVNKLGYTPSYKKVWLGKQKAIEHAFGDWDKSYNILPKFMEALKKFNPGTIVEWFVLRQIGVEHMEFRRVFWAFDPSINGFKHCRPVISIDATHLYGKYKGKMMIAMGVDGNNQIFPLAFAIVENESYASWSWFLSHVKKHVVKDIEGICLISDRHVGILKAVKESPWLEPHGFHGYCLRHFINNFNDKFCNSQLKVLAYHAGSQNQIRKFNSIMEEIGKINSNARQWLEEHAPERWTLAHDGGKRYGLLTTNLSKIFNSVLKGARFLPITACVQLTFYRLVHYFDVRRPMGSNAQAKGDIYTPHVLAKQAASMSKAGAHSLRSFNQQKGIFEVITQKGKNVQVVDLDKKNLLVCWQYVDKCYSIVDYRATWLTKFSPLPHEAYWSDSSSIRELLPKSELKRDKKGRPRSTRLRNGMDIKETKKANLCGICKQPGHNRATCPNKPRRMDA
ncbi:uncharacterized protein LOC143538476 [Bidens hawaiensis]|uniref:uncharacterized protein LOC143538476 n=1 Tax=Bidens hawaiensis TaxID=980011 RepID=UPI00404A458D